MQNYTEKAFYRLLVVLFITASTRVTNYDLSGIIICSNINWALLYIWISVSFSILSVNTNN